MPKIFAGADPKLGLVFVANEQDDVVAMSPTAALQLRDQLPALARRAAGDAEDWPTLAQMETHLRAQGWARVQDEHDAWMDAEHRSIIWARRTGQVHQAIFGPYAEATPAAYRLALQAQDEVVTVDPAAPQSETLLNYLRNRGFDQEH